MKTKTLPPLFTLTCEEYKDQTKKPAECYDYLREFKNESPAREKFFGNIANHGVYVSFAESMPGLVMEGRFFYPGIIKSDDDNKFVMGFGKTDTLCAPDRYEEFALKSDKTYFTSAYEVKLDLRLDIKDALEQIEIPTDELHKPANEIPIRTLAERNLEYRGFFLDHVGDVVFGSGFMQSDSLKSLQDQPKLEGKTTAGYCIFIGYDKTLHFEKNRLVFIAVDTHGKLILDDNAITLERSWPPR